MPTTAPASSGKNATCRVKVARPIDTPVSSQRRCDRAQIAPRMKRTIGVFSRGPSVARSMKPWKLSMVAAAARPAVREVKRSRATM